MKGWAMVVVVAIVGGYFVVVDIVDRYNKDEYYDVCLKPKISNGWAWKEAVKYCDQRFDR